MQTRLSSVVRPRGSVPSAMVDRDSFGNAAEESATAGDDSTCTMVVDSTNTPYDCTGQDATIS